MIKFVPLKKCNNNPIIIWIRTLPNLSRLNSHILYLFIQSTTPGFYYFNCNFWIVKRLIFFFLGFVSFNYLSQWRREVRLQLAKNSLHDCKIIDIILWHDAKSRKIRIEEKVMTDQTPILLYFKRMFWKVNTFQMSIET